MPVLLCQWCSWQVTSCGLTANQVVRLIGLLLVFASQKTALVPFLFLPILFYGGPSYYTRLA